MTTLEKYLVTGSCSDFDTLKAEICRVVSQEPSDVSTIAQKTRQDVKTTSYVAGILYRYGYFIKNSAGKYELSLAHRTKILALQIPPSTIIAGVVSQLTPQGQSFHAICVDS